ncbi:hypothetical protein PACTADRAFT_50921 [Pachysolen tannophilus NRRL Y-2460]|uniref:Uncharacterized protein n=1 Tax=Pachysolen tannophilus NRRL Y-2460 TaxID=669874 RepID=A0A1E4TTP8_PACTA|nr:hypothetical protein PACTADRAFT_50921 [Pachysolen tannophilus NRRL Y-2460]
MAGMELIKYPELADLRNESFVIRCPFKNCNSRIIDSKSTTSTIGIKGSPNLLRFSSPVMISQEDNDEKLSNFYFVDDVWKFDNIGVSKPHDKHKDLRPIIFTQGDDNGKKIYIERLLICSDCDKGPLGFAGFLIDQEIEDTSTINKDAGNLKYFLSCDSILYQVL